VTAVTKLAWGLPLKRVDTSVVSLRRGGRTERRQPRRQSLNEPADECRSTKP
jgi:hypothetical protein